jgi:hypothetical protein
LIYRDEVERAESEGAEDMIPDMCERMKEKCTIKDLGTF